MHIGIRKFEKLIRWRAKTRYLSLGCASSICNKVGIFRVSAKVKCKITLELSNSIYLGSGRANLEKVSSKAIPSVWDGFLLVTNFSIFLHLSKSRDESHMALLPH